jgi:hypothetical protein
MAVSRRALIIANPGVVGADNYCDGVNKDVATYRAFLQSKVGGAWKPEEIIVLKCPTLAEMRSGLQSLKNADYSFIVFTGHGEYLPSKDTTTLELRPGVNVDSKELFDGATKRTVVLDCCRGVHVPLALDEAMMKALAKADSVEDKSESRKYYDKAISECPESLVVLFGCSIRELAGDDDQRGGVYSYNLIRSAEAWAFENDVDTNEKYSILSVVAAHELAKSKVIQRRGTKQNPTIEKPRSGPYFPFGVVA